MGKKSRAIIWLAALAVVATVAWTMIRAAAGPPEPMYKGKSLSYWLDYPNKQNVSINSIQGIIHESQIAIQHMGTNAIPFLLWRLRAHDSPLKDAALRWASQKHLLGIHYADPRSLNGEGLNGFQLLGPTAVPAVPELIKILDENISESSVRMTLRSLESIGPEAKTAGPVVVRLMSDTNADIRLFAYTALTKISADPDIAVPALIKRLAEPWAPARGWVVNDLGDFGGKAKAAIPALVALYHDTNANSDYGSVQHTTIVFGIPNVQNYAQNAINKIDPETYDKMFPNRVRRK